MMSQFFGTVCHNTTVSENEMVDKRRCEKQWNVSDIRSGGGMEERHAYSATACFGAGILAHSTTAHRALILLVLGYA